MGHLRAAASEVALVLTKASWGSQGTMNKGLARLIGDLDIPVRHGLG